MSRSIERQQTWLFEQTCDAIPPLVGTASTRFRPSKNRSTSTAPVASLSLPSHPVFALTYLKHGIPPETHHDLKHRDTSAVQAYWDCMAALGPSHPLQLTMHTPQELGPEGLQPSPNPQHNIVRCTYTNVHTERSLEISSMTKVQKATKTPNDSYWPPSAAPCNKERLSQKAKASVRWKFTYEI